MKKEKKSIDKKQEIVSTSGLNLIRSNMRSNAGCPCLYSLYAFPASYALEQVAIRTKSRSCLIQKKWHDYMQENNRNEGKYTITYSL
jgi:hypothetical protein